MIQGDHDVSIAREHGTGTQHPGHRARCSCGWSSDCCAMLDDAERAAAAHLRRSRRQDFDALIARSSIGAAIEDIRTRGLDAHLADLEARMSRSRRRRTKTR